MRAFVTGGAGFIGSSLVDRLLADGHDVVAYDNFSTGQRGFLSPRPCTHPRFTLIEATRSICRRSRAAMAGCDVVFHLAANADVRFGTEHPRKDLEQNTIATFNVLEAMRANGIKRIAFSSTGSVYGEAHVFPTPEDAPFPVQTSLYGASKLAGEGLIAAYCRASASRAASSASSRFSASATRTATSSTSTGACARIPTRLHRARQRQAAQVVPLHPRLPRRDAPGDGEDARAPSRSSTSAPTSTSR